MSYHKGSLSKTHPGDFNFTTKKGDMVFHRNKHYVRKSRKPYSKTMKGGKTKKRRHKMSKRRH